MASRDVKKDLFVLPNGKVLTFAPHYWRGEQSKWYFTENSPLVWQASKNAKHKLYRLNLWSSKSDLHVIAVDYDETPEGFYSFDELASYFKSVFSAQEAIVCRTPSNKVKVFFLVQEVSRE